jgi:hypothetical protein
MNEELYVIQTKTGFKKFPIDKRNRLVKDKDDEKGRDKRIITTMDFLETYHYAEEELANQDLIDFGLSPNEFEVKKYSFTYQEVN